MLPVQKNRHQMNLIKQIGQIGNFVMFAHTL